MIFNRLTSTFNNLLLTVGLGLAAVNCGKNYPDEEGTELEMEEIDLMEGIAGCSIETDVVRKKEEANLGDNVAGDANPSTKLIRFISEYYSANFGKEMNAYKFHVFVHEMVHIWQFQNLPRGSYKCDKEKLEREVGSMYRYDLTKFNNFFELCSEQQAELVADYVTYFLHPKHQKWYINYWPNPEQWEKIANIVEAVFVNARGLRLNYSDAKFHAGYSGPTKEQRAMHKLYHGPQKCLGVGP